MRRLLVILATLGLAFPVTLLAADEAEKPSTEQGGTTETETDEEPECD